MQHILLINTGKNYGDKVVALTFYISQRMSGLGLLNENRKEHCSNIGTKDILQMTLHQFSVWSR